MGEGMIDLFYKGIAEMAGKYVIYSIGKASVADHEEERDTDSPGCKAAREFYRKVEADAREINE